jgi:AraC family transcriptional regulator of adaptative response / methylphosphotriester-DNA alkyltransferase methyltransferase
MSEQSAFAHLNGRCQPADREFLQPPQRRELDRAADDGAPRSRHLVVYSTNDRATLGGLRAPASTIDRPSDSAGAARRRAIFEEAVAAIEHSYDHDRLSLADVAQTIFTSKRQLQRAFAEAGTSFQATLHAIRMERSAELLVESSLPVSAIAHRVGYRSHPQFTKAFRRHYQLAPTQLRSINSNSTANEVSAMDCKCGCQTADPPQSAQLRPRPKHDEQQRELERRLEALERRLQALDKAA